ncbi:hypothetical protein DPMN_180211 [Dreissena polymorpha]|uniref:Uncharacterized protein n=1 Tax=Dreissena polymorpha TaxID=45954 RepID=A0A9D4EIK8_DREPO|nr:hypothetical protein DPMN_180211 [Dreissena polymorpha]
MEIQASCVILLLQKAVSMVRADPRAANGVTLAMVDTPTSSPTLPCREVRLTKGKKVATKVDNPLEIVLHLALKVQPSTLR